MFRASHLFVSVISILVLVSPVSAQSDPGVRGGPPGAGGPLSGLNYEKKFFDVGLEAFTEINDVRGTITGDSGLGPTFNLDSCAGCHAQPAVGGSSPAVNPQIAVASKAGATNTIPSFITLSGPVREARFKYVNPGAPPNQRIRDGGVHGLFTIAGRSDAAGCTLAQPNFAYHLAYNNVVFRIPTPTFGAGLIEAIRDQTILANEAAAKPFGITGHANHSGNDGTVTRFGWKAQNKSLIIFSGEAYNAEQGVTNEVFPDEREGAAAQAAGCLVNNTPEDKTNFNATAPYKVSSDVIAFSNFMRLLAAPVPVSSYTGANGPVSSASIANGATLFNSIGCAVCHIQSLPTGSHSTPVLAYQTAHLFSDLLVHHMGSALADDVFQGAAGGDEFRTAPLWGLGQRIFFLHDGRRTDLQLTILDHASNGSEANAVIANYKSLAVSQKQDLLNFLRSL
jgi:CxxC motif-containing protein (DUF1111 family)